MNNQLSVRYEVNDGQFIELNYKIVRDVLAAGSNITDNELYSFIKLCEYQKLNPFLKEAYLIKYGKQVQMVVGKDVFTNRLNEHPLCEGWNSGIIVEKNGEIIERKGTFYLKGTESLVGAWVSINRKGWKEPFYWSVNFHEYYRENYDKESKKYKPMGQWGSMPSVMIVKCAITSGARNLFPKNFGGMYSPEEMGVEPPEENQSINNINKKTAVDVNTKKEKDQKNDKEVLTDKQRNAIVEAAKSKLLDPKDYDSSKLLEYVFNSLIKNKSLPEGCRLFSLTQDKYEEVLFHVKQMLIKKENMYTKKNGVLPEDKKTNPTQINVDDSLPLDEMKYAEPANLKNNKKDDKKDDKKQVAETKEDSKKEGQKDEIDK